MSTENNTEKENHVNDMQSPDIKKLATALAKAQGAMGHATKNAENDHFHNTYADLAAVIDAGRKPLSDNGLAVVQAIQILDAQRYMLVTTLMHSSGQWTRSFCPILTNKNDAQGLGSGLTYMRRYSYAAMIGVAQEDDDGNGASERRPPVQKTQASAQPQAPKNQAAPTKNHAHAGDPAVLKINAADARAMFDAAAKKKISPDDVKSMMQAFHGVSESKNLTVNQHAHLMNMLKNNTAEDIGRMVMEALAEKQLEAEEAARKTEQIPT